MVPRHSASTLASLETHSVAEIHVVRSHSSITDRLTATGDVDRRLRSLVEYTA